MAQANLSELVTTTLRHREKALADNVTKSNALLQRLETKGNTRKVDGGRTIVEPLDYQENSTYKRYSGSEVLDISAQELFSAAEFNWKQAAVAVNINGLEALQNSSKAAAISLVKSRVKNAERSFANNMGADVYSDGTADGGKQVGGLQLLVADDSTTGTVGGIDRANFDFWRNYTFDATTDGTGAVTSTNVQGYMNDVFINTTRGRDHVDLIVSSNDYWQAYLESLQNIQRIQSLDGAGTAGTGFMSLKYMNADVVMDGGTDVVAPTDHMYFLNTDFIHYVTHSDRSFKQIGGNRQSVNQDATVKIMAWAGNMTMSGAKFQGVLKD